MHIPESFEGALRSAFSGRLSIRWSDFEHAFVIESRLHAAERAKPPRLPKNASRGEFLRWQDERIVAAKRAARVMAIAPGDRIPCPTPGCMEVHSLPPFKTVAPKCIRCGAQVRSIGFYPLGETLLDHLKWSDPERGGLDRVMQSLDFAEEKREAGRKRELHNHTEAVWKEDFARVVGIQSVGYTGKEFRE